MEILTNALFKKAFTWKTEVCARVSFDFKKRMRVRLKQVVPRKRISWTTDAIKMPLKIKKNIVNIFSWEKKNNVEQDLP